MKWRFFRHLLGGDDEDSERVYRWHIAERSGARMQASLATDSWKRTVDDYVESARSLAASMASSGFDASHPIPLDPNLELLDGSHRVACAIALRFPHVGVRLWSRSVWAPAWDLEWFVGHGMRGDDLARLNDDWKLMQR